MSSRRTRNQVKLASQNAVATRSKAHLIGHRNKANALRDYLRLSIREFCDRQRSRLDRWTELLSVPIIKPLHIRCTRLRQLQLESLEGRSLLTSGVLDFSFGVGGKVLTDIGGASNQLYPHRWNWKR